MIEQPERLNNQAILLASDGDFTSAIACFKRAITIQQNNSLLWYNLGVTYRDSGDIKNARKSLEKAYFLDSNNQDITEALAAIYLQQKQFNLALEYCLDSLKVNNTNSRIWNLIGVIEFQKEEYESAIGPFENALTLDPNYEDALFNLRDTYLEVGNKTGAEECSRRLKNLK